MLVIRMQRTGRRGHAQFRVVVQDSRRTPTSGRVVAALGSFNPHSKETTLDKEKASFYLEHGAQPSDRVIRLLKAEGVKLPEWVKQQSNKQGAIKNVEKLRKNRPASAETTDDKPVEAEAPAAPAEETPDASAEAAAKDEQPAEEPKDAPAEEQKPSADEPAKEAPAAEDKPEEKTQ